MLSLKAGDDHAGAGPSIGQASKRGTPSRGRLRRRDLTASSKKELGKGAYLWAPMTRADFAGGGTHAATLLLGAADNSPRAVAVAWGGSDWLRFPRLLLSRTYVTWFDDGVGGLLPRRRSPGNRRRDQGKDWHAAGMAEPDRNGGNRLRWRRGPWRKWTVNDFVRE